jgi:hypothetical protein
MFAAVIRTFPHPTFVRMQSPARPAVEALYAALSDVASEVALLPAPTRASLLKYAVYGAVDELKRMGLSSARVEAVVLSFVETAWPIWGTGAAAEEVRAWCIQRYYEELRS